MNQLIMTIFPGDKSKVSGEIRLIYTEVLHGLVAGTSEPKGIKRLF